MPTVQIYDSYDQEPQDVFHPLTEEHYSEFYDLELGGFSGDLGFYQAHLPENRRILELGCGTGRLSRLLSAAGHQVTGIDLCEPMLQKARQASPPTIHYLGMDMRRLAFSTRFEAIVIAYNTLNLFIDPSELQSCLRACRRHLLPQGHLLAQIHIPTEDLTARAGAPSFQFKMFDRPQGGKTHQGNPAQPPPRLTTR